ncbi:LuxR C-terminal-related transcriptional regulator [Actinopolymorpha sp. B17G11]|uniref:LuxR C-terminal-related transcriptional regulator n=1 Tax=Actinopolymorpha sp. B17G11 TaxID=3160861 RepID=UPI0032E3FFD8
MPAVPVLPRPRLFHALTDATERRVTVLNASAGAGKTMLLASWSAWSTGQRVAWVSCDRNDNEPKVFWACVVEALRRVCGRGSESLGQLAGHDDLADPQFAERLLDTLAPLDDPVVLVLDQAHEITDWRLLAGLEILLRHAPPTLRLVLSGRGFPALSLARLRVAGELADIGPAELACTPAETRDLFALFGLDLAPPQIAGLLERTGGWMAGLRLATLWWQAQPPQRRDPAGFTGDEPLVADYLSDEVVGSRSSQLRRFLLRTCVVDRVTGELADVLTGGSDGQKTLDVLERENALVVPVGRQRTWYHYSPLLREFLTDRIGREMPDEIAGLHRLAAGWLSRRGFLVDAARNAAAAGDWRLAGTLLAGDGDRASANGEGAALEPLLAGIPADEIAANPELAAVCATARLNAGDPDGAEAFLSVSSGPVVSGPDGSGPDRSGPDGSGMADGGTTTHDLSSSTAPAEAVDGLAREVKVTELRLHQGCLRGRVDATVMTRAHQLLDDMGGAGLRSHHRNGLAGLAYWLGIAELWNGHLSAARTSLARAVPLLAENGFGRWERRAHAWLALLDAVDGRLERAERAIRGERSEPPSDPVRLLYDMAQVVIDVERDRLDQAWNLLATIAVPPGEDAADAAGDAGSADPPLWELYGLLRARILIHQGDLGAARAEIATAKDDAVRLRTQVKRYATLLEIDIALQEGNPVQGRAILSAATDPRRVGGSDSTPAAVRVADGRLHLASGDPAAALDAVTPCLSGTSAETRLVDTVAALLVAATAQRRLGTQASATGYLEQALALGRDDGLVRVFLDAGRGVRALLTVVIPPEGPHASFRSALLHRFDVQPTATWKSPDQTVRLTASERAVLHYLPSHLTNEEIAQDLCLSVNTVKSHLRTLYRKLGVGSRREAIARALQLELLR